MRIAGILVGVLLLDACTTELDAGFLHAVPSIEVTTELATEVVVPLDVMVGETEIDDATFALDGVQLGTLRAGQFVVSGLAAGRATLSISYAGNTVAVPIHVRVESTRVMADTPASAISALAAATAAPFDAQLTPANGARIPPNLGTIEVDFAGAEGDDVFEVRAGTEDLDLRVVGPSAHAALSPLEWRVITASAPNGHDIGLTSRSLSTAAPAMARTANTRIALGKQPMAKQMLFSAFTTVQQTALYHYDAVNASPIAWMEPSLTAPATPDDEDDPIYCIGCHASVSKDGSRIAVITTTGLGGAGTGAIIDTVTKSFLSVDETATWTSSAYDPSGLLITAQAGVLTLRDGDTATALQTLTTEGAAASPFISPDGALLGYGVLDATSPSMITAELRVHPWDATTGTLGPAQVLVPADGGGIKDPSFSSDGAWVLYGHTATPASVPTDLGGLRIVRTSGAATPIELAVDSGDVIASWASDLTSDGAWITIKSRRTVGGRTQPPQLWMAAFDPASGTISTPFHLPGQPTNMTTNHAPRRLPD